MSSAGDTNMTGSADGQGQVFQAGRDIVISGQPHANARKLTVLNVEAAAQVLTEMAASADTRDEAVVIVADMEPEVAATRLAAMPPESAAQILARMDHQLARQRLLLIPTYSAGGAIFGHLPNRVAAKIVDEAPLDTTLSLLAQIAPEHAAAILAECPDSLAVRIIITVPVTYTEEDYILASLFAFPFSTKHAAAWLERLPDEHAARVVAAAPAEATAVIFAHMSGEVLAYRGSTLLFKVDDNYLRTLLTSVKPVWRAGDLLHGLADDRVAAALVGVPETRCAVLLAQVHEERAAEIVQQMPQAKQQRLKDRLW